MSSLKGLQDWFAAQCNGDWEHGHGITIDTIDNPGWHVRIELEGTVQAGVALEPVEVSRGEDDWYQCRVNGEVFEGFGAVSNLDDILDVFLSWTQKNPKCR